MKVVWALLISRASAIFLTIGWVWLAKKFLANNKSKSLDEFIEQAQSVLQKVIDIDLGYRNSESNLTNAYLSGTIEDVEELLPNAPPLPAFASSTSSHGFDPFKLFRSWLPRAGPRF